MENLSKFSSIEEAYAARRLLMAKKTVTAIVYFQHSSGKLMKPVFLEQNQQTPAQAFTTLKIENFKVEGTKLRDFNFLTIIERDGKKLDIEKMTPKDEEIKEAKDKAFRARSNCIKYMSNLAKNSLKLKPGRHAEEKVIENFDKYKGFFPGANRVYIMLTHSPCTIMDEKPSKNLKHNLPSCHLKLLNLAKKNQHLDFYVDFLQPFGRFEGNTNTALIFLNSYKEYVPNIYFSCVTS